MDGTDHTLLVGNRFSLELGMGTQGGDGDGDGVLTRGCFLDRGNVVVLPRAAVVQHRRRARLVRDVALGPIGILLGEHHDVLLLATLLEQELLTYSLAALLKPFVAL